MSAPVASSRRRRSNATSDGDVVFASASAAFARADNVLCRDLLTSATFACRDDARIDVLRARNARALADAAATYDAARAALRRALPPADRLTALALLATSAQTLGNVADSERFARECEDALDVAPANDADEARAIFAEAALDAGDAAEAARWLLRVPNALRNARTATVAGEIALRQGALTRATVYFARAVTLAQGSLVLDARTAASALTGAANVALESANLRTARRIRRVAAKLVWTSSLRAEQFAFLTAFRGIALLEGDLEQAWVLSRAALAVAPNAAYEAIGEVNAATATRLLGDEHTSDLQLKRAWEALRREPNRLADRLGCAALAHFASEAPRLLPAESRKALTLYRSFARSVAIDETQRAAGFVAIARVAEAIDDRGVATHAYREALALYQTCGMSLRAALVGLDLRRLTRDATYAEGAAGVRRRAPQAWFERELREEKTPLRHLRPAQREILARLLRGESAKMIAGDLERSTFTVSNHTRKIFSAFNVHSRDDLRAKCTKFGITEETLRRS